MLYIQFKNLRHDFILVFTSNIYLFFNIFNMEYLRFELEKISILNFKHHFLRKK